VKQERGQPAFEKKAVDHPAFEKKGQQTT